MERRAIVRLVFLLAALTGCDSTPTEDPPALPGPSTMKVSAIVRAPAFDVDGTLSAQVKSDAISAKPLRSRYRGEMMLRLTQAEKTMVDLNTAVEGEFDGSPTEGMVEAFRRFLDTVSATTRPAHLVREPERAP